MDIQNKHEEYEAFMLEMFNVEFDDFEIFKRQKFGNYFTTHDDFFKVWLATQAKSVPKWVDLNVAVPDDKQEVLVIFEDGTRVAAEFDRKFGFSSIEDGCAYLQHLITHWMPLPEAPEAPKAPEVK